MSQQEIFFTVENENLKNIISDLVFCGTNKKTAC